MSGLISDKDVLFKYSIKFTDVYLSPDMSLQKVCDNILDIINKNSIEISDMRIFEPNVSTQTLNKSNIPVINIKIITFMKLTDELIDKMKHLCDPTKFSFLGILITDEEFKAKKLFIKMYLYKPHRRGIHLKVLPLTKFIKGKYYDFEKAKSFGWEDYINSGSIDFKEQKVVERAHKLTSRKIVRIKIIEKKYGETVWDLGAGWNLDI